MKVNSKRIRASMQKYVDGGQIAGIVIEVAREDDVIYGDTFGVMDVSTGAPMQKDTIFRIASMTKPITAVAVLMLADKGHVRLEDPISAFMPSNAARVAPITNC